MENFYLMRLVNGFNHWFNSDKFPKELEKADVEECVLAWADYAEVDLGDNLDELCKKIVEFGIC